MNLENIRNFCIIAHIDHGKSTLADRMLEITGTVEPRDMKAQFLDSLDLERERGITIKMAPVRMVYRPTEITNNKLQITNKIQNQNSKTLGFGASNLELSSSEYVLNLIDTPGHPDFAYEVSRAFKAVEGAILLVDASQGIQAQTLANFEMARKAGLKIIGAVNKIDLNPVQVDDIIKETAELIGVDKEDILKISGKTGQGVEELLETIIKSIPPPRAIANSQFPISNKKSALIFDSLYDDHKGVIGFVRVFSGEFKENEDIKLVAANIKFKPKEVGYFAPQMKSSGSIKEGNIGYIATGIKDPDKLKIGDTMGDEAVIGYEEPQARVFVSFFSEEGDKHEELKKSFQKLRLTDPALKLEPDSSEVLGRGFKVGFLGKLHFEITSQRLEKEFGIKTINSFPSVSYKARMQGKKDFVMVENPNELNTEVEEIWEPMIDLEILTSPVYLGSVLKLKDSFRMENVETQTMGARVLIKTKMPLVELISDFDDQLKSSTHGFASFSYQMGEYKRADLIKMEVLLAGDSVTGLARVVPKDRLEYEARQMAQRLKDLLPQQQFTQAIQVMAGSRIVARETVPAMRKDVTGYLYGGDRTRKMKLWKKQKEGKKKLLSRAKVNISAEVFKELLKK